MFVHELLKDISLAVFHVFLLLPRQEELYYGLHYITFKSTDDKKSISSEIHSLSSFVHDLINLLYYYTD